MKKVFILTINGTIHIFNQNNINKKSIEMIKMYSNIISKEIEHLKNEKEICEYFIIYIKKKLNIILEELTISDVVRINANIS